jgi:flavin-dependent dehydrogenase
MRVFDPMILCAAQRRQVRLRDGTTATLVDWRRNGDTVKVLTPEYRHRILPKAYVVEVVL